MRERVVLYKPAGMTFDEAAAIADGGIMALSCLRRAGLQAGQRIVVYGASGSIGTAAVQLARHFDAHVTAVCDTKNVELVRSLGADEVVDYTREDFTANGETYDAILDAVGKHSFRRSRGSLKPGGIFLTTDLGFMWHAGLLVLTRWSATRRRSDAPVRPQDLLFLKQSQGGSTGRVDRSYPLEDVVEATICGDGTEMGNVVLTVDGDFVSACGQASAAGG